MAFESKQLARVSILFGVGLLISVPSARAATITTSVAGGQNLVVIHGRTDVGDAEALTTIARSIDPRVGTVVTMSGPGGVMIEGIKMGAQIHKLGWTTKVEEGRLCISACAMTWLGGTQRVASAEAHIGFHAPYDAKTHEVSAIGTRLVKLYTNVLGLDDAAVSYIMAKGPGEGYSWIDKKTATAVGISMNVVPSTGHAKVHASTVAIDESEFAQGQMRKGGEDTLANDLDACYATYLHGHADETGFKCFTLEATAQALAKEKANRERHPLDVRFTMKESVKRVVTALTRTGHSRRQAQLTLRRWASNLSASAVN